jgi:hypothetical protein
LGVIETEEVAVRQARVVRLGSHAGVKGFAARAAGFMPSGSWAAPFRLFDRLDFLHGDNRCSAHSLIMKQVIWLIVSAMTLIINAITEPSCFPSVGKMRKEVTHPALINSQGARSGRG